MDSYDKIASLVLELADYACDAQADIARNYKEDGTVLTEADTLINTRIGDLVASLFPEANVVTEEAIRPFRPDAPLTFILDPIDGTDVYSQGLPGWCIALGVLDGNRQPIGGMVCAPRWGLSRDEGLFLRLDPGKGLTLNGKPFKARISDRKLEQIALASHAPRHLSIKQFDVKLRCYGSNILHMISPLIHPHVQGSVSIRCYAWDIAGAHALLHSQGFETRYVDDTPFVYDDELLAERKGIKRLLLAGTEEAVSSMQGMFT